jgi:hypothetical protein
MVFPGILKLSRYPFSLLIFGLFVSFNLNAQEWELVRTTDGIDIYTKKVENSAFKAFKAESTVDAELTAFVAVLLDIKELENWGYKLKETKLLERQGDSMQIYFAEAKAPFPFSNRYGIYLNTLQWDKTEKLLTVNIEILQDHDFPVEDLVQMKGSGYWKVKVLENNKLKITFEMHVDPGKTIPSWLANMFVDESPYDTMNSIRKQMKKTKYQNQSFDFLND